MNLQIAPSKNAPGRHSQEETDESWEEDAHSGIGLPYQAMALPARLLSRSEKNPRKKSSARVSVSSPSLETGAASGAERYCVERQTWRARRASDGRPTG